ncbi:MAG: hypothetical protein V1802_01680 [Candidatus Aenigmatarchaeota archaeon]
MSKGISPLIASVMLIVIVITLSTLVSNWLTALVRSTQEDVGNKTSETVSCTNAGISINDAFVNINEGKTRVIVRNTGFMDITLTSAQIYSQLGNNYIPSELPELKRGDIKTLVFSTPFESCNNFSYVIVTTSCGTVSGTFKEAPTCV